MSLMGIDIGTTGTKIIAFNCDGVQLAESYADYDLLFPKPGWVEMDVHSMWKKILLSIKQVNTDFKVKKDPVEGLSVSTFGESFTPIDARGNIIYNTIYATDTRSINEINEITDKISYSRLYEITGSPPKYISPLPKLIWFRKNMTDLYEKTKKFLFTEDLLFHYLGIEKTSLSHSLASKTLFFDIKKRKWSKEIVEIMGIDIEKFSDLSPSGELIGYVGKNAAEKLGFSKKTAVVTGGNDQPCAALGIGSLDEGISADGVGTFECITTTLNKPIINKKMLKNNFPTDCHVLKNKYVTLGYNSTAGAVIKWYIENLAEKEKEAAKQKNVELYKYIYSSLNMKPSGLLSLPYFSPSGTPYYDPVPKGAILGISILTSKNDLFKALIEGLVFEIFLNIELQQKAGIKIKELRAVGGGSNSDFWMQLKSTVFGKPIKRMDIAQSGCLATMILAGYALKKFSIEEAVKSFVKVRQTFYPDEKLRKEYLEYYYKYKKLYKAISSVY